MAKKRKPSRKKDFLAVTHGKINRKLRGDGFASDLGSPDLERHHVLKIDYVDAEGKHTDPAKGRKRARNVTQTTLDYCKTYALISEEQHIAGEQLYADCYYSGLVPRAIVSMMNGLPRTGSPKFVGFAEGRIDAQRRYSHVRDELNRRYIDKSRGITFFQVAYRICIDGIPIDELEKWSEWPRRSGKKLIGLVLDAVYEVYDELHNQQQRKRR